MNYLRPERLDHLAREYALGTLAGRPRRRFERVLRSSRAAALAVDVWRQRLAVLDLAVAPVLPRESNWRAIERRLFTATDRAAPGSLASGGALQVLRGLFSGRGVASVLAGALLCLLVLRIQPGLIGMEPRRDVLPASYVGLLLDQGGKPTLVASSRRYGRELTVKLLQPLTVPSGHVAQLWALPKDGSAPLPIGVIPAQGSSQVALSDTSEKLFFGVSQLAVSFEKAPAGSGAVPTDSYALIGHCVKVW